MSYEPYYIDQLTTGLDISKEPRLIQPDGFPSLINARVSKGKLTKRPGYSLVATTGNSNPIVGIGKSFIYGPNSLLVADTKRLYKFEPVQETLTELTSGDTFTGSDWNYFQMASWQKKTYLSNWIDPLYVTEDESVSLVDTGDVTVTRAQHIFVWKNRLHLINVVINGNEWYPQRHMWSDVLGGSDPTQINFTSSNYIDGEFQGSDDVPMMVRFFRGIPYVFFKQFAVPIQASRVASNPFSWGMPIEQWGSIAQNFGVITKNGIALLNERNIDVFDGYRGQAVDLPRLRDFVDTFDNRKWHTIVGTYAGENDYVYMTYAEDGQEVPNKILEMNILDGTFSIAGIAMNYIYGFDGWYSPEWVAAANVYSDDYPVDGDFDPDAAPALDMSSESQLRTTPTTYGGDSTGNIYDLNSGADFNTATYPVTILSAKINPYQKEGRQARIGRIEFYVDVDATASYTLSLYKNQSTTAFKTFTISCAGSGDKVWVSKNIGGEVGDIFQFKLSHTAKDNSPVIHAIRVWLQRGGPIWQK